MNWETILPRMREGLQLIQNLEPLAGMLGGTTAAGIANVVAGLAEIGENALLQIEGAAGAISTEDEAELRSIMDALAQKAAANNAAVLRT